MQQLWPAAAAATALQMCWILCGECVEVQHEAVPLKSVPQGAEEAHYSVAAIVSGLNWPLPAQSHCSLKPTRIAVLSSFPSPPSPPLPSPHLPLISLPLSGAPDLALFLALASLTGWQQQRLADPQLAATLLLPTDDAIRAFLAQQVGRELMVGGRGFVGSA